MDATKYIQPKAATFFPIIDETLHRMRLSAFGPVCGPGSLFPCAVCEWLRVLYRLGTACVQKPPETYGYNLSLGDKSEGSY
jgi:hypothetical protein